MKSGVAPRITVLNENQKIKAIPRGRDNSDDLYEAVEATHARMGHIRYTDPVDPQSNPLIAP